MRRWQRERERARERERETERERERERDPRYSKLGDQVHHQLTVGAGRNVGAEAGIPNRVFPRVALRAGRREGRCKGARVTRVRRVDAVACNTAVALVALERPLCRV